MNDKLLKKIKKKLQLCCLICLIAVFHINRINIIIKMILKREVYFLFIFVLCLSTLLSAQEQYCSHPIFCNQTILEAVSNSNLFQSDFKEFVDLVLKVPVETAL